MAAKSRIIKDYAVSFQEVCNVLASPQFAMGLKFSQNSAMQSGGGKVYTYKSGVSFSSWGEKISISVFAIAPTMTKIDILSECAFPTQVVDWGKNQTNINNIIAYLDSVFAAMVYGGVNMQGGAQMGGTQIGGARGGHNFCTSCGAKITPGSAFCSNCGAKL